MTAPRNRPPTPTSTSTRFGRRTLLRAATTGAVATALGSGIPTALARSATPEATPDGTLGFVTQGGDGEVVVLNLAQGEIAATFNVPSALDGGGYLAVFGTADTSTDSIGR